MSRWIQILVKAVFLSGIPERSTTFIYYSIDRPGWTLLAYAVLETSKNSNVFLYIVKGYIPFDNGMALEAEELGEIIESMHENKKYRQMF